MTMTTATQNRRMLIQLSRKYVSVGTGSMLDYLNQIPRKQMTFHFQKILKNTPYLLVGGLATHFYMPARMTLDADILILTDDVPLIESKLTQANYQQKGRLSIGGSSWESPKGEILDVIVQNSDWAADALKFPNFQKNIPVIPLPYLILMKLLAGRMQDLADITRMLGQATEQQLTQIRTVIAQYQPDALEDIESMVMLGKLETN